MVTISSAPPSSEDDGDDESEEVVDGFNGQTTSFLSLRSSSCNRTMSFFISKLFRIPTLSRAAGEEAAACAGQDNFAAGAGPLSPRLGFHIKILMSVILNLPLGPTNIVPQQISFLFQKERSIKSDTLESASRRLAEVIWKKR